MIFSFGPTSLAELVDVHPGLVRVVHRALTLSPVDFAVHDGLRTDAEQHEYVRAGVSPQMSSKHLRQADGFGHAVDLIACINGKLRWEHPPMYRIAAAVRQAAEAEGVAIKWGGCWVPFSGIAPTSRAMEQAVADYEARRRKARRAVSTGRHHFELLR